MITSLDKQRIIRFRRRAASIDSLTELIKAELAIGKIVDNTWDKYFWELDQFTEEMETYLNRNK